ncbi:hypothetical protein [Halohasta salina]|uniref:hypothetical protein n=1 Tax=Halohasta salina TaxID=2961621 RepID=UPI0020A4F930|nr:hypothetical protein [Halohasta salina]
MADRDPDRTEPSRDSDDPRAIRTVAVTVDDVVAALEANRSADRGAVLRITPPFSGRMRARIHAGGTAYDTDTDPEPIHLDPERLVDEVPDYPTADETRSMPDDEAAADIDTRRQRHTERVEAWRETVRGRLAETVDIGTPAGDHTVRLIALGE